MEKVISLALMALVGGGVFALLYWNRYLIVNAKSAAMFVGSCRGTQASFTACNGHIKRILRFKADETCTFTLTTELSRGEVPAELLDGGAKVMELTSQTPRACVAVQKGKRYALVIRFKSATGKYTLGCEHN